MIRNEIFEKGSPSPKIPRRYTGYTVRRWLTKWLTNQVETGGSNSDTICLNTL
jgi:hypothetical protein